MVLCNAEKCNSCLACYNTCPFNAIEIKQNEFGAKQPVIRDTCKNCGLCYKACIQVEPQLLREPIKAIALYTRNENDRNTCSSGGAATAFSRYVIAQGGNVYGATSVGGYPHYIKVQKEDELEFLKGSKYVYCDPERIYIDVKQELQANKLCLFIGLPCHVAGLLSFLRKDYWNLFTVDLICHGTPPFSYLKEHLEAKVGDYSKIGNITFRGKNDFYLIAYDRNNKVLYKRNQYEDEYFMSFMKGFIFRQICYDCQFAQNKRVSDITIGDYWNIPKEALNGYRGKISLALINSNRGLIFFQDCKDLFCFEERDIQEAIYGNEQLNHPFQKNDKAHMFVRYYKAKGSIVYCFKHLGVTKYTRINKIKRYILYIPKIIKRLIIGMI